MRVLQEIPHPDCKITIFSWNNRYLIKVEQGPFEQTYKLHETDVTSENELYKIIDTQFIEEALARFVGMAETLQSAVHRA